MSLQVSELGELVQRAGDRERSNPDRYPVQTIEDLFAAGFLLAPFAQSSGGSGWTALDSTCAIEALASHAPSAALIAAMPLGLAGIYGRGPSIAPDQHRAEWITQTERVAADYRARRLYAACNSEAGAGGSLAATKTAAHRTNSDSWTVSGVKILASAGRHADYFFSSAKVSQEDLPGAGVVEFFFLPVAAEGVAIAEDWNGFGMRATESQTVQYQNAAAVGMFGFPNFLEIVQPVSYWYCLFAAIPLGCAAGLLQLLGTPQPSSPALRLRLADARMKYESLAAYLHETASQWVPAAGSQYAARVLRTKTFVSSEATKLCAELFALTGGRQYVRDGDGARFLADSFAGTALRPPLALALDALIQATE